MDAGAAFWIFLAVMVGVGAWAGARKEAEKHQTLRRLLDQGGALNEPQLRELLRSFEKAPAWQPGMPVCEPPNYRRQCRVTGAIFIAIGVALMTFFGLFFSLYSIYGPDPSPENVGERVAFMVGGVVGVSIVVFGAGIYLIGRFFPAQPRTGSLDLAGSVPRGPDPASSATSDAQGRFSR